MQWAASALWMNLSMSRPYYWIKRYNRKSANGKMVSRNYLLILLMEMNISGSLFVGFSQIRKMNVWALHAKILTFSHYLKCIFYEINFILGGMKCGLEVHACIRKFTFVSFWSSEVKKKKKHSLNDNKIIPTLKRQGTVSMLQDTNQFLPSFVEVSGKGGC